jgi:monothiol glutaredoxin
VTLDDTNRQRIEKIIGSDRVVLFMKGDRNVPQCGFSATVVQILDTLVPEYTTVDVLSDPRIREGIKEFSSWPTIPQLYVGGEFLGGCDIVREMYSSGELQQMLAQAGAAAPR